jgi:hypothetical protein
LRNQEIQDSIAQELKAFIMGLTVATVCKRFLEPVQMDKAIVEAFL